MDWITVIAKGSLGGYVLAFVFLNCVAFLISAFYQRKFDQPSPRAGFVVSSIACIAYIAISMFAEQIGMAASVLKGICVLVAAGFSAWSTISLQYTMKRVRK